MKLRDMPRELAVVTFAMIVANITSNMYAPYEPLYLESLGAGVRQVGFFFTAQTIMSIAFRVLGGWISDNLGRLPTIALGSVFGLLAYLGYTLAPTWAWAMFGALMGAAGSSLVAPSFQAYTAESAPEGKTASTFGLVEGLFLTCQIVGPLLGGFLVENHGFKVMMWTATGIFAVATVLRLLIARGKPLNARLSDLNAGRLKRDLVALVSIVLAGGVVTWLFIVDGLRDASFQVMLPFLPKYATEIGGLGETMYGALFAGMSVITALAMVPGGMLADRYGEHWGISLSGVLVAASLAIMVLFPTQVGFIAAFGIFGIAIAFGSPAFSSLLSKSVPKESLGIMYGIFWSALGIVAVPMPYIGGLLYDNVGPQSPFWVAVVVILLSAPLALWKLKRPAEEPGGRGRSTGGRACAVNPENVLPRPGEPGRGDIAKPARCPPRCHETVTPPCFMLKWRKESGFARLASLQARALIPRLYIRSLARRPKPRWGRHNAGYCNGVGTVLPVSQHTKLITKWTNNELRILYAIGRDDLPGLRRAAVWVPPVGDHG